MSADKILWVHLFTPFKPHQGWKKAQDATPKFSLGFIPEVTVKKVQGTYLFQVVVQVAKAAPLQNFLISGDHLSFVLVDENNKHVRFDFRATKGDFDSFEMVYGDRSEWVSRSGNDALNELRNKFLKAKNSLRNSL